MRCSCSLEDFDSKIAAWEKLPKGWDNSSLKKFWETMTGDVKHKVKKCMKEMEGKVTDTGAFCASLADKVDPGWRSRKSNIASDVARELKIISKEIKAIPYTNEVKPSIEEVIHSRITDNITASIFSEKNLKLEDLGRKARRYK